MQTRAVLFGGLVVVTALVWTARAAKAQRSQAQSGHDPLVRIAEIEIDPQQIEPYKAALRAGIEAAILLEPGVLSLYAVSAKGHPEQVRVVEVYADEAAYQSHLQTPHFKRYKAATMGMVRSLKLTETESILLGARQGAPIAR